MTINGVEKSCMKSAEIVNLIDVLITAELDKYQTVEEFKVGINNRIEVLRGEVNDNK